MTCFYLLQIHTVNIDIAAMFRAGFIKYTGYSYNIPLMLVIPIKLDLFRLRPINPNAYCVCAVTYINPGIVAPLERFTDCSP